MQITRVSTAVIEANFDWTIVKVETAEGVTGYGEAFMGPGLPAVIAEYAGVLIGEDPTSIDRVLRRLYACSAPSSPGLVLHAVHGIEGALLDAIGKHYKLPVWQILGGKYRAHVRVYADCHAGEALESLTPLLLPRRPQWAAASGQEEPSAVTPGAYAIRAREMAARGFGILKFDVDVPTPYRADMHNRDLSGREVEHMAALVAAAREAVGPDVGLAVDCHWSYSTQAAINLARALERYNLMWLEDPTPPENIAALGTVQRNTVLPLATGENHYLRSDFERLIVEAGLRVLAPDVQKIGLWQGRKIADLADVHYVNLTLHNISGPIGTMAGVHLCAAIPNFLALEWHAASVPFFDDLVKGANAPLIGNGRIAVPDAPGLGIELDEDVANKYRKPGEKFF